MNGLTYYDLYQPGPIAPVVQMMQNLSVFTGGVWEHYKTIFIEPMPLSSQSIIDMVNVAGATTIAANGTLVKRVITQLRVNLHELLILRWKPLEALEGILWEQPNKSRFESRALFSRVDWRTEQYDPYLATTTFCVIGATTGDRDFNLEVRNPQGFAYPMARFQFWGHRYLLNPIEIAAADKIKMRDGDIETIKRLMTYTTFIVAEGRS